MSPADKPENAPARKANALGRCPLASSLFLASAEKFLAATAMSPGPLAE
jgi:hypothetical protein